MSGSPLAYPLTRGIDGDSGGAADLQTDIMRFMAILSLCLVAIFALVQSVPIEAQTPTEASPSVEAVPPIDVSPMAEPVIEDVIQHTPQAPVTAAASADKEPETESPVSLTRPKWESTFQLAERITSEPTVEQALASEAAAPTPLAQPTPSTPPAEEGFTLRFESDTALTRLVATGQVGFYAINSSGAQRMTVSDSRISFWEASTPNEFHEMEAATVPQAVVEAHQRSGTNIGQVSWGVTLPGKLRAQLDSLMQDHRGGALVIQAYGQLNLDAG